MQKRITQKLASSAKPRRQYYRIYDPVITGLILQIQPTGRKFWKVQQDRQIKTIGQFPHMTASMAEERVKRILTGEDNAHRVPTLDEFLKRYYQTYLNAHHSRPQDSINRIRRFGLDNRPLDQISLADVERWRTTALSDGKQASTINRDVNVLRAALEKAYTWDLIDVNPLAKLKPLRVDTRGVIRYLDLPEEARLLNALDSCTDRLRAFVTMALKTGCRRGELWNLTWSDVDLRGRQLVVQGKGSKSGQTRFIPLNGTAIESLKAWRGDSVPMPSMPVFGRFNFDKEWWSLLRKAQVETFRFHDCRHSFASRLVQAGVDLNVVRELLGHSDMRMTMRYAHLRPDNLRKAVELLP